MQPPLHLGRLPDVAVAALTAPEVVTWRPSPLIGMDAFRVAMTTPNEAHAVADVPRRSACSGLLTATLSQRQRKAQRHPGESRVVVGVHWCGSAQAPPDEAFCCQWRNRASARITNPRRRASGRDLTMPCRPKLAARFEGRWWAAVKAPIQREAQTQEQRHGLHLCMCSSM